MFIGLRAKSVDAALYIVFRVVWNGILSVQESDTKIRLYRPPDALMQFLQEL